MLCDQAVLTPTSALSPVPPNTNYRGASLCFLTPAMSGYDENLLRNAPEATREERQVRTSSLLAIKKGQPRALVLSNPSLAIVLWFVVDWHDAD